jgi:A/G-specific adenine glycosylase
LTRARAETVGRNVAIDGAVVAALQRGLLDHFDRAARALPWRTTRDPYAIWVSEVMSQQTRVETVVPYYTRWLRRFPDVDALARAEIDDVLKEWEGLGYYSRARNLHAAAKLVCERHSGVVPVTYGSLRDLPGVGEYTAGAVASIAGGQQCAAIDGNVRRVLARLFDLPDPSASQLRTLAALLVPPDRPGDFNQSLMELGATICTPRAPRCTRCPVVAHCAAERDGTQLARPVPKRKAAVPTFDVATAVLVDGERRLLLVRRTTALLHGMWTFPGAEIGRAESASATAAQIARQHGCRTPDPVPLGTVEHTFSHRRERYISFIIHTRSATGSAIGVWAGEDLQGLALPRAQQRIRTLAMAYLDGER